MHDTVVAQARLLHVPFVFVSGNGTLAECGVGDGLEEGFFVAWFDACFDEVTHGGR